MNHVFDAGPMIALLSGKAGANVSRNLLVTFPGACYAHIVNLAEVYYIFYRRGGVTVAENAITDLYNDGIIPCGDSDESFWKEAASYKGRHAMALADGFCIALARRLGGTVVTTDHNEFDPLVPLGYAPILFIR